MTVRHGLGDGYAQKAKIPPTAVGGCVQVLSTKRSYQNTSKSPTRQCGDRSSPNYSFASLRLCFGFHLDEGQQGGLEPSPHYRVGDFQIFD